MIEDHPMIRRLQNTGFPYKYRKYPACTMCGEEAYGQYITLSGDTYCLKCVESNMSIVDLLDMIGVPIFDAEEGDY